MGSPLPKVTSVSWWLYLLISCTLVLTFLLTTKLLDNIALPLHLPDPQILSYRSLGGLFSLGSDTRKKIDNALSSERSQLSSVMSGYALPPSVSLSSLQPEQGGQPLRAMVVTTWRSGSTFLGDIMSAHPGTYYHYEPLLHYDIRQARTGALAEDAIRTLRELMQCNYTRLDWYLRYGRSHPWLFKHNERLWKFCVEEGEDKQRSSFCWRPEFLNRFCSLFPFQSIKTVRLRLNLTEALVQDPGLNVQLLLLVRDPRGTLQSRKHRDWCPNNPDCEDPAKLCQDLKDDYQAFIKLRKKYPGRYEVFRYEDFSMDPVNNTATIFKFFGFHVHPKVTEFLDSHTKLTKGGVSSTFRDSKTAPFKWREKLTLSEVLNIQSKCSEAMKIWGYKEVYSESELRTFQPVFDLGNFSIS